MSFSLLRLLCGFLVISCFFHHGGLCCLYIASAAVFVFVHKSHLFIGILNTEFYQCSHQVQSSSVKKLSSCTKKIIEKKVMSRE